ncbi:MAG: rhodanese-like domain-containing protein [Marinisporobacter sp.]|nr:rhodanese-like domain-containing protein [Marinisporobacter sp.]
MFISNYNIEHIFVEQIEKAMEEGAILLDIRHEEDYNAVHIPNSINIPLSSISLQLKRLDQEKEILVICYIGQSSKKITYFLKQLGFRAKNVQGGMNAWKAYKSNIRRNGECSI